MTLISNRDSLDEGFIRAALEITSHAGSRSVLIARSDYRSVRKLLDEAPGTMLFTQAMAEFYLDIPRRQFEALKRAYLNPFSKSVGRPKRISRDDLLARFARINKSVHAISGELDGRLGRTAGGTPFIVMLDSNRRIICIISHAGITILDLNTIEDAFANGAKIAALRVGEALSLTWEQPEERRLWRNAYRIHIDRVYAQEVAVLDRQDIDERTVQVSRWKLKR